MALKRTPDPDDTVVLRHAGFLGHRYVTTQEGAPAGADWSVRILASESDTIPTLACLDERGVKEPRTFEQVRFASRLGRKWRRVR